MRSPKKIVLLLAFCSLAVFASAQSLADIAKQKPQRTAKHVYTNDEIPSSPLANETPKAKSDNSNVEPGDNPADKDQKPKPEGDKTTAKNEDSAELKAMEKDLSALKQNIVERRQRTEDLRKSLQTETDPYQIKIGPTLMAAREHDLENMGHEQSDLEKKIAEKREQERKEREEREKQQPANGQ
jgi:hypothetical protein